ncbi:MAG: 50S ribosomal protein L9 [Proteobacteria bacterium]|nr:50S ribosomal protein L9 [Pseudomonadota bacterium]
MNVILLEKMGRLGKVGDQVKVRTGYGRNYLLPQGKAILANPKNIAIFEERRAELEAKAAEIMKAAEARAAKMHEKHFKISAIASEEGKLYGSVGTTEIVEALKQAGHEVEKREVCLPNGTIHSLGEYDIELQLHADVSANIHIEIVAA